MMLFCMFTMMGNIPKIATDLVGGQAANLGAVKALGEQQVKWAISKGRQAVEAVLDAKTGGQYSKAKGIAGGGK